MGTVSVQASELTDAREKQIQAAQSYYKGLRKLGPNPTPSQVAALKQQTITPAQAQITKAVTEANAERIGEIRQAVIDGYLLSKAKHAILPKFIANLGKKISSSQTPNSKVSPTPDEKPPQEEAPALDGSNIPKEIFFPGKKKK